MNQTTPEEMTDPRQDLTVTIKAVDDLLQKLETSDLAKQTPCSEFTVADLIDHVVMVARRIALIGNGEDFAQAQQEKLGDSWFQMWQTAKDTITPAWADDNKLTQEFNVPWGRFPGGPVLFTYVSELAVHGRDLAVATDNDFAVADHNLHGAFTAAKFIPAEARQDPEMPFDEVVTVDESASVLDQMAGWYGRKVA